MEIDGCPIPEDRLYDLERSVWAQRDETEGGWVIGILAPFAAFIGPVARVTFRPSQGTVEPGRSLGMLESTRFTGALRAPIAGTVTDQNLELLAHPRWLNDEAYGRGWFARIRPSVPEARPAGLETAEEIRARLTAWIAAQRVRCWPQTPDLEMFEIGIECSAILAQLNDELERRPGGTAVRLVTDDPTSPIEMERWSLQTGHALLAKRKDGNLFEFLVRKEEHPVPRVPRRG